MRAVAEAAGVSLGNAYYYFASKAHLLHGYYAQSHADHLAAARPVLAREKDFRERLRGVLRAKLVTSEPYHRFAQLLFGAAADPESPLNPFHPMSADVRREAVALMAEVLKGAKAKVPSDLAARLPELLWVYEMGIILFWVHDASPGRARSHVLVERTTELVARLVRLASNPLLAPLRKAIVRTLDDVVRDPASAASSLADAAAGGPDGDEA
jgi:AcrR family transcriptional regulator